ncbi:putative reverse transcriptase domain-containing protein [Tanacetum coccineum]
MNEDGTHYRIPKEGGAKLDRNSNMASLNSGLATSTELDTNVGLLWPTSYAKLVTGETSRKSVNFYNLIAPVWNGANVAISLESICAISERYANMVYGFFLGIRVAYPVVDKYVKNTWSLYGLVKSMLSSSNSLFFFKFSSKDGMDAMLDNGPWFICNDPFILKKWNPDVNLFKSKSSYARALIELRVNVELKDTIMVYMPKLVGEMFYMSTICVSSSGSKVSRQEAAGNGSLNVVHDSSSTTSIIVKIDKRELELLDRKLMFVDDDGKSLYKVDSIGILDSNSEMEEVYNVTTGFMASMSLKSGSNSGYGTNSFFR